MTEVQQLPNHCFFACLESIILDLDGKYSAIPQDKLRDIGSAKLGGPSNTLLDTHEEIRSRTGINIVLGSPDNLKIEEILRDFSGKEIIITLNNQPSGENLHYSVYAVHAIRVKKTKTSLVQIMDPGSHLHKETIYEDNLVVEHGNKYCDPKILDAMRGKGSYLNFFVVD
jgi:hypothetical protein